MEDDIDGCGAWGSLEASLREMTDSYGHLPNGEINYIIKEQISPHFPHLIQI